MVLGNLLLEGQLNISDRMNAKKQAGNAPNAQNKSIGDYGSEGWEFESLRARKTLSLDSIPLSKQLVAV